MARSRRARGTGSYDYDEKRGFYRWRLGVLDPISGKTKYIAIKAKSRTRLKAKVDEWKKEHGDGEAAPIAGKRWLVKDWVTQWLSLSTNIAPTTRRKYEEMARNYMLPRFGNMWLGKVSPLELQQFFNELDDGTRKKSTVAKVRETFRICFNAAIRYSLLAKNPIAATIPPKIEKPELRILEINEVSRLLKVAKSGEYIKYNERDKENDSRAYLLMRNYLIVLIAVASGMRQGEILGLAWDCVNGAEIKVQHTLQNITGARILKAPKTRSSKRVIIIPSNVAEEIKKWKKIQDEYAEKYKGIFHNEQNLVFTSGEGTPVIGTNFTNNEFREMCEAAEITPKPRFHDLRHFFVALAVGNKVPFLAVSEQLGHASVKMTLDQYAYVLKESKDELRAMLDENPLFNKKEC